MMDNVIKAKESAVRWPSSSCAAKEYKLKRDKEHFVGFFVTKDADGSRRGKSALCSSVFIVLMSSPASRKMSGNIFTNNGSFADQLSPISSAACLINSPKPPVNHGPCFRLYSTTFAHMRLYWPDSLNANVVSFVRLWMAPLMCSMNPLCFHLRKLTAEICFDSSSVHNTAKTGACKGAPSSNRCCWPKKSRHRSPEMQAMLVDKSGNQLNAAALGKVDCMKVSRFLRAAAVSPAAGFCTKVRILACHARLSSALSFLVTPFRQRSTR